MITDREKAAEIAGLCAIDAMTGTTGDTYKAAMMMASWKDKQFAEDAVDVLETLLQGGVHPQSKNRFIKEFLQMMELDNYIDENYTNEID